MTAQVGPPVWSASVPHTSPRIDIAARGEQATYRRNRHQLLVSAVHYLLECCAGEPLAALRACQRASSKVGQAATCSPQKVGGVSRRFDSLQQIFLTSIGAMLSSSMRIYVWGRRVE